MRMTRLAIVVLLAGAATLHAQNQTIQVYPIRNPQPDTILQSIREVIGNRGTSTYNRVSSRLIVTATPEDHAIISALLKEIDVLSPNIRLDVTFNQVSRQSQQKLGADLAGGVTVTPSGAGYHVKIKPHVTYQSSEGQQGTVQTVVVVSGGEGVLQIGDDIPFFNWLVSQAQVWGIVPPGFVQPAVQEFERRQVGSYLRVQPRLIGSGPLISVTLTPEVSMLVGAETQRIRYSRVATTVTIRDGATLPLGGLGENQEFYDKFLTGIGADGSASQLNISLKAAILPLPAPPPGTP